MLEALAQSSASLRLTLYTTNVEQMILFYKILGFIVVEDHEYISGRNLVMALHDNAGAQVCLAQARTEAENGRTGKQFFSITSPTPFIPHKVLSARGFRVSEYSAYAPNECFTGYDPEGNEVFVGSIHTRGD